MKKIILSSFLFISILGANLIDISIENKLQKFEDHIFKDAMDDGNFTDGALEKLSKTHNNINFSLDTNYKEMVGFNYKRNFSGIDYDKKEIYIGNPAMKYLSLSKTKQDIDYGFRNTKKDIASINFLHILTISKEEFSSVKNEILKPEKLAAIPTALSPVDVHRNYTKEVFVASSENLYEITKQDAKNGEEYFQYGMFVKNIGSNFKVFGVPIISLIQYNYTKIENYFVDGNGTRRNIAYSTKIEDGETLINESASDLKNKPNFDLIGKYRGFEYGFKITGQYLFKDYNFFLTLYQKYTDLTNKHKKNSAQSNLNSSNNNALEYRTLKYKQGYASFGVSYSF